MGSIPLVSSELGAMVLETVLTGIALTLFSAALHVLVYRRGALWFLTTDQPSSHPFNFVVLVITVVLLFAIVTVRLPPTRPSFFLLPVDLSH